MPEDSFALWVVELQQLEGAIPDERAVHIPELTSAWLVDIHCLILTRLRFVVFITRDNTILLVPARVFHFRDDRVIREAYSRELRGLFGSYCVIAIELP